ncbi:MAG TPA: BTAD domain-containing putative transcriptional regulator [Longimicrobiales bacterium]
MSPEHTFGRGSVPVELTRFIGRADELAALGALAGTSRLLTLTGAGGSGKSRLALELVPRLVELAPAGVAWVELASLGDPQLIPGAVLHALGVPAQTDAATADTVADVIRDLPVALVLDNCEHLVDACAELVDALLRTCGALVVLATSREALGVRGERSWLVPPLQLPAANADIAVLEQSDAVRLFVDRARDVVPDFRLDERNAAAVAEICARLDGIPLAIELAAARVRHMPPQQISRRLTDVFALLTTGSRTAIPRHRTLRAALDWSHDLLPAQAQVVLRRLSVFRRGFTLDAVEAVAAGDGVAGDDVLDLVSLLVDRSMIVVREQYGQARYQLLETMRLYAEQRLREAGEELRTQRALADWLADLVARLEPVFLTTGRRTAFRTLYPELDNIREVLNWTRMHDPLLHIRIVGKLWWFWFASRFWNEAHRWMTEALALPAATEPTPGRAALLMAAGGLAAMRSRPEEAIPLLEEAQRLAASLGEGRVEADAFLYLGIACGTAHAELSRQYALRAADWYRASEDLYGLRAALLLLASADHAAGDPDGAMAHTREALALARRLGTDRELAMPLQHLAMLLLERGDVAGARAMVLESLHGLERDPSVPFTHRGIEWYAATIADDAPRAAAYHLGMAESVRRFIGARRFPWDVPYMESLAARLGRTLGQQEYERAFEEGLAVPATDALDVVLHPRAAPASAAAPNASQPVVPARAASVTAPAASVAAPAASVAAHEAAPPSAAADASVRTAQPARTPALRVLALGPFRADVRGEPVTDWPYAKPKELLVYLLCHPAGRTRVEIGGDLWPGNTPAQIRNSFHVTLHHLRKALGSSDWVVVENERYRIAPDADVEFDAAVLEAEVRAALVTRDTDARTTIDRLQRALALYRGHLLGDESAGAWRDEPQDRYRRVYCDGALLLGTLLEERGDVRAAAETYESIVAREPLHEEAYRRLLRCWTRTGERARALRHYERFATVLRDELDLEPEPETLALVQQIRSS